MISDLSLWAHSIENLLSWTASSLFSIIWWGFLRHFVGSPGSGLNISLTFYLVTRLSGEQGRWAALGGVSRHRHLLSLAAQSLRQRNNTVEDGNNFQTSPSVSTYYYWLVVILLLSGLSGGGVLAVHQCPLPEPVWLHSQQPSDPRQPGQVVVLPSQSLRFYTEFALQWGHLLVWPNYASPVGQFSSAHFG